ncbi:MAG TPA: ABC transporter ATP-binding protein [Stellaceae bacterium]|nr:ABC transporter ATP-binding protein [Stellaceae bacterium]
MAAPASFVSDLLRDIRRRLGWRAPLLVLAMSLNGITEGLGLALLLPLLSGIATGGGAGAAGTGAGTGILARFAGGVLDLFGFAHDFSHLLAVALGAFLLQNAASVSEGWLSAQYRGRYIALWREDIFASMMGARWRFFLDHKTGQLTNALLEETMRLGGAFYCLAQIAAGGVFVFVYVVLSLLASWEVALGTALFGAVMWLCVQPLTRFNRGLGAQLMRENETLHVIANEFIGGARLIKAAAAEDRATGLFTAAVRRIYRVERLTQFHPFLVRSIYEGCAMVALCGSLWIGVVEIGINPATVLVTVYLFIRLYLRLSQVQQYVQILHATYAPSIAPALETLADARRDGEAASEGAAPVFHAAAGVGVRARDLEVRHGGLAALDRISLELPAGAMIGLAGPSGAGKSTFADCLLGLVAPDAGAIEIDSQPLATLALAQWRRNVGYVAQDTFLFNASIAENIRWGNPDATDAEIAAAARRAHADEFIRALPHGYATEVGERGMRLSGGERQRIGLARALVGHARLLVIDEATSALDSESEQAVMRAIFEMRGQITILIIAHRLSTLREADLLYLIERGRIVERGTWQELSRPGTRFFDFWKIQSEEHQGMSAR